MYPEINALVDELHGRGMSTFLVTNAQFPDSMQRLKPVTQLYVSVDAATKASLKSIDRPLFGDFWERFQSCLTLLRQKRQRTVYRMTLVKEWNMKETAEYATLIKLGEPDFVEIKGATYCGESSASGLTMKNIPYHTDVCAFAQALCHQTQGSALHWLQSAEICSGVYGLACEHAHSCCVLLARIDRFFHDRKWHTWIDYDRFSELVHNGGAFGSEDYQRETPDWAVYGATRQGFDPAEQRFEKCRQ